jgi:hypothetical protein
MPRDVCIRNSFHVSTLCQPILSARGVGQASEMPHGTCVRNIAIQKAIPAVGDRLHTMTGVIQNSQVTYTQAFRSLETKIEQLTNVITDFAGGTFTLQHIPRSKLNVLPPRGASGRNESNISESIRTESNRIRIE